LNLMNDDPTREVIRRFPSPLASSMSDHARRT